MLKLISYLAPSIPAGFFTLVARHLESATGLPADVTFETRISGPLDGDDDPFADGRADVGFICSPSFRFLRGRSPVELLPLPVPLDARAEGRPVYFADVVVHAASPVRRFEELRGAVWGYNDRNSKSGWFSMLERTGGESFFNRMVHAGSHLRSLDLVLAGEIDAAAIDSNTLALRRRLDPALAGQMRVLESWGPFPIQPVIIRSAVAVKERIREALLTMHQSHAAALAEFGWAGFAIGDEGAYR
ncbi:MAG TPA: PhnD/SsuA/transferrin family substrate-binding protein [Thermoanaerobaculia bacterium]|nr:PhnD/SsuA/transferrin family substrate-binding protein [Thermoanaerobaculia bacterium]